MHIDRSRFLLLTASLAALGCNQRAPSPTARAATPGQPEPSQPPPLWLEADQAEAPELADGDQCGDEVEPVPSCASLQPSPTICSMIPIDIERCSVYATSLVPRAAGPVVSCLLESSGTHDMCLYDTWSSCLDRGVAQACPDASAVPICASLVADCGAEVDAHKCEQAFSALRPEFTEAMISCVLEFCDPRFCIFEAVHR